MLKKEEKKKEEIFSFKKITHLNGKQTLDVYESQYLIKFNEVIIRVIVNLRTSSCGSIQLSFMNTFHNSEIANISKNNRADFFNYILSEFGDHNHVFFIDMEEGMLERFFGDLGFSKVWNYLNYNSENHVNMWCFNKWTDDEVREKLEEEEDDDAW